MCVLLICTFRHLKDYLDALAWMLECLSNGSSAVTCFLVTMFSFLCSFPQHLCIKVNICPLKHRYQISLCNTNPLGLCKMEIPREAVVGESDSCQMGLFPGARAKGAITFLAPALHFTCVRLSSCVLALDAETHTCWNWLVYEGKHGRWPGQTGKFYWKLLLFHHVDFTLICYNDCICTAKFNSAEEHSLVLKLNCSCSKAIMMDPGRVLAPAN